MKRGLLGIGVVVVWGLGIGAVQQPAFRSEIDLVSVGVSVLDRRGAPVTDLSVDDFEVVEDGTRQRIRLFARGDESAGLELHVGLLLDTSESMSESMRLARTAAVRFLNALSDAKDMTLVDFDTEVRVARYGQADFPRMVERIRSRQPEGFTAMYDALGVYLDGASENEGRTILVLYTDGGDTRSTMGFGDLMTLVRASNVTIHVVGLLDHRGTRDEAEQRARLIRLAEATGGQAFFPTSMKEVESAYDEIVSQIRAQYTLGYTSTNTRAEGKWRKVEIRVVRRDLKDVRVHARKGYFGIYRQP